MTTTLRRFGYGGGAAAPEGTVPGRVVDHRGSRYTVVTDHAGTAREVPAVLKGSLAHDAMGRSELPAVGDFVWLLPSADGVSRITGVQPRWSTFSRADLGGRDAGRTATVNEQVVATNFDYVFILTSLNADFSTGRIARYVTQAYQSGGQPVVLLTKADAAPGHAAQVAAAMAAAPGVPVHAISAHTGAGLDALDEYLQPGTTIVCLGSSGVGKSSLLNTLLGEDAMAVSAIREGDAKGRHTTTHRQLFLLPSGAMLIDTPGMREIGLYDADAGTSHAFADVEELFARCRFRDCTHTAEPGCAALAAVADGTLPAERWQRYQALAAENRFVADRTGHQRDREAAARHLTREWRQARRSGLGLKPDQR